MSGNIAVLRPIKQLHFAFSMAGIATLALALHAAETSATDTTNRWRAPASSRANCGATRQGAGL